jgi:hypothetical protein
MTPQPPKVPCPDISSVASANESVTKARFVKAPFVKPHLTCYGKVVDLTQTFGGSLTPEERESQGLD